LTEFDLFTLTFTVNVKCGFGNRVFLTLWTTAIRSNTVAGFEQKCHQKLISEFWPVDYLLRALDKTRLLSARQYHNS